MKGRCPLNVKVGHNLGTGQDTEGNVIVLTREFLHLRISIDVKFKEKKDQIKDKGCNFS
jgi:hypothetical protein